MGRPRQGAPRPVRRPPRRPRVRPRSRRDLPGLAPAARPQGGRPLRGARRPGPQEGLPVLLPAGAALRQQDPLLPAVLKRLQAESDLCSIYLLNAGTRQRLATLLRESDIPVLESDSPFAVPPRNEVALLLGPLPGGFSYPREKLHFFSEKDIFTEEKVIVSRASRRPFFSQFQDLQAGDYVVHTDYGIGVFRGLQRVEVEGKGREFIELNYRDGDKLLVPVEDLNLVQKFAKAGPELPPLDKLGTNTWEKTRTRAKKAVEAVAKDLVELYAKRRAIKGHAFSPGGEWDEEFGKTFEYEETEDQLRSIR
ncbi:MAG: hypothetical protein EHM31_12210, partial [Candidatus Aminicenantes bacterium]